jgi:hypothetical protein
LIIVVDTTGLLLMVRRPAMRMHQDGTQQNSRSDIYEKQNSLFNGYLYINNTEDLA